MYTATLYSDKIDKLTSRRIVTIRFTDGVDAFNKRFEFHIDEDVSKMKRRVNEYLNKINAPAPEITGDITDYVEPATATPSAEEMAAEKYLEDYLEYEQIMRHVDLGIIPANHQAIAAKKKNLIDTFKASYPEMVAKHKDGR